MASSPSETSTSLLQRLRRKEPRAWEDFATKYIWGMRQSLRSRSISPEDIDDVLQDSCLRVFRNIHKYRHQGHGSFRAWLKKVSRSCWLQAVRKSAYRARSQNKVLELSHYLAEETLASIDMQVELLIEQELFDFALARTRQHFNDQTWNVYRLAALAGLPSKEVAEMLGISVALAQKSKERFEKKLNQEIQAVRDFA
ncbi:MAG: RNA polymerase sigma factor [Planctomycetota bacterium]